MNVSELIDYLQQFNGDEAVVIDDEDFIDEGDYISLRWIMS